MATRRRQTWVAIVLVVLAVLYGWVNRIDDGDVATADPIESLYRGQRSGSVVEASGIVSRTLPDDIEGSRHQRFILRLPSGHTLLVSHNIDLAPRVSDLKTGDEVTFRGQYEWNERGGVVHWTHHDPQGERPGGWLRHRGQTYR